MNPHQTVQSEMRLADEHLRKAMAAAAECDDWMRHEISQLVFSVGAELEAFQTRHSDELDQ